MLKETFEKFQVMNPTEIIGYFYENYSNFDVTCACSFGAEDVVLIDMISKITKNPYIFTIDTGRLPDETYQLMDRIRKHYGIKIRVFYPDASEVEELVSEKGFFSFRASLENRKECCRIRKVNPLKRALSGSSVWISGLRNSQSVTRADLSVVEEDASFPGLVKISPLLRWSDEDVWSYIRKNNVPYNELHDNGYPSIGCLPCTRAIKPGDDIRSGRWWWEKPESRECGLHLPKSPENRKVGNVKINLPKATKDSPAENAHLDKLENLSIYVIREAYHHFKDIGLLWSIGKDSTVLLWLIRKAFFGRVPFPCIHCDTSYKFREIIEYRDHYAKEWGLNLIVGQNKEALDSGMGPDKGKFECCTALKTNALAKVIDDHKFKAVFVGIRRDEEGSRGKERYFSPRGEDFKWNYKDQPPELWDQFSTDFDDKTHVRIHPLLHWSELDIWEYIKRENIPMLSQYFAKSGKRYRSVGCECCCSPCDSNASNLDEIVDELKNSKSSERAGRAHDKERFYMLQKLRAKGFM
jgi:sulfate adenylyltransferase subunit 2